MSSVGSPRELLCDAGSDDCARGGDMGSSPSACPCPRRRTTRPARCTPRTALHGARSLPPESRRRWSTSRTTSCWDRRLHWGSCPLLGRSGVTVRHSAGDAPLLVVPSLRAAGGVDGATVSFLLAENLKLQKEEEEKERRREAEHEGRMQELDRRVQADVPLSPAKSRASPSRRGRGERGTGRSCPNLLPHAPFVLGHLDLFLRAPCL